MSVRKIQGQDLDAVIEHCIKYQHNERTLNHREAGETALCQALKGSKIYLKAQGYLPDEEGAGK